MDDKFKQLVQELGEAINESLADSERISGVMSRIRASGYALMLVLEVTIGYSKRKNAKSLQDADVESEPGQTELFELTPHDARFLRALKITVEEK